MGFNTLKDVIDIGKNIVDISFFSEDPFELDDLAKKNNVIAITDCGVAPGMGNIIFGFHDNLNMQIDSYECYVGGLPVERQWPYEYKQYFPQLTLLRSIQGLLDLFKTQKSLLKKLFQKLN